MKTPPASIIVPTLNEEKYLPALLASLAKISAPLDIIVVDGDSIDGTAHVVQSFQTAFSGDSSLTLIRSRRGISSQRNTGAAHAKHPILIFCDADIVFPSAEAYSDIVSRFKKHGYVAAAPVMLPVERGTRLRIVYRIVMIIQKVLFFLGRPYFAGSCLLTTKDVFAKIGGFDINVLLGEDVDYSLKAAKIGPCGLLDTSIRVSARRLIKYGYWWILKELPNVFRLLMTGRIIPETIFYPFGDFGDLRD